MIKKFGHIKNLREDNDKAQQELADFLSLTRSAYSNYENDIRDVPVEVLSHMANYYHTSVDYLINRTDDVVPGTPKKQPLKTDGDLCLPDILSKEHFK